MEHTPRPWMPCAVEGGWDGVKSEDGQIIANLVLNNPANAHLIAAAPDLLAACENFREWWANNFDDFSPEANGQLTCLDNDCETAINKAIA